MNAPVNQLSPADWVKNHGDYLYSFALRRVNDADTAKDLVQETFLAALQKAAVFEGRSAERTWLTAILRFKIIDVYRKKTIGVHEIRAEQEIKEQHTKFFDEVGHWAPEHYPKNFAADSHDLLQAKELKHILQQCIKKLPALWMSVFTMKFMDDDSAETICESLKVTPANYWVIIHRAKLNLRDCLQKNWI